MQATITSKGRVTLPKPIRDELHLEPGDKIDFVVEGDGLRVTPVNARVTPTEGRVAATGGPGQPAGDGRGYREGGRPTVEPMIGLDANVLVRCIVQDDPEQAARPGAPRRTIPASIPFVGTG